MEGKLAPPPKFYSGPLFRNTCDLICPLGKAILLRQMDEISPHVSGGAMLRPFRSSFARHQGRYIFPQRIILQWRRIGFGIRVGKLHDRGIEHSHAHAQKDPLTN